MTEPLVLSNLRLPLSISLEAAVTYVVVLGSAEGSVLDVLRLPSKGMPPFDHCPPLAGYAAQLAVLFPSGLVTNVTRIGLRRLTQASDLDDPAFQHIQITDWHFIDCPEPGNPQDRRVYVGPYSLLSRSELSPFTFRYEPLLERSLLVYRLPTSVQSRYQLQDRFFLAANEALGANLAPILTARLSPVALIDLSEE